MRVFLIGGVCAIAVTACAPSYQTTAGNASAYGGYSNSQTGYGYEAAQTNVATHRSRYGAYGAAGLRGSCNAVSAPCGFTRVVPVYPVYQYVTAPEVPVVETPQYVEPEPIVIYEPEPVYEPPVYEPPIYEPTEYSWPEPDTPAPSWKPLRK